MLVIAAVLLSACATAPARPTTPQVQRIAALEQKHINWLGMVQAYMYSGR